NKVHNALPVYGAISDSESEVRIVDHPRSKEQNYIDKQATQGTLVPAYQLNSFCNQADIQTIDFLKIDVEGAELPALRSLGKKITDVK
ncbi:hypothetical protein DF186_18220, partial [Enterococcus hirae]